MLPRPLTPIYLAASWRKEALGGLLMLALVILGGQLPATVRQGRAPLTGTAGVFAHSERLAESATVTPGQRSATAFDLSEKVAERLSVQVVASR